MSVENDEDQIPTPTIPLQATSQDFIHSVPDSLLVKPTPGPEYDLQEGKRSVNASIKPFLNALFAIQILPLPRSLFFAIQILPLSNPL